MTITHGAYAAEAENLLGPVDVHTGERNSPRCPVVIGRFWCSMPPNHLGLECQHVTVSGSVPLGVIPVPSSVAMRPPLLEG